MTAVAEVDEVLRAQVVASTAAIVGEGDDEAPVTEHTLEVLEVFDGSRTVGEQVVFRVPGGPFHEGHVTVPGAPRVARGDEVIVALTPIDGAAAHRAPRWEGGVFVLGERADGVGVVLDHRREAVVDVSCDRAALRAFPSSRAPVVTGLGATDEGEPGVPGVADVSVPAGPVFAEAPREVAMPWAELVAEAHACAAQVRGEVAP